MGCGVVGHGPCGAQLLLRNELRKREITDVTKGAIRVEGQVPQREASTGQGRINTQFNVLVVSPLNTPVIDLLFHPLLLLIRLKPLKTSRLMASQKMLKVASPIQLFNSLLYRFQVTVKK